MSSRTTIRGLLALLAVLVCTTAHAEAPNKAEVMLVGVFHFANPGLDSVKSEVINVLTEENQAYLEALTDRIAATGPTAVLLEYSRENDELVNQRYQQYLAGEYELGVNEIYQLGFRIAQKAGLNRVHSYDEREIHWNAKPLMERMAEFPDRKAELDQLIADLSEERTRQHQTLSLAELLADSNDPIQDQRNKGLYLLTNDIGAAEAFEGADATASWWHRNFRMYSIIQQHAQPGMRVVAIGGQGHTAILKDLLADDPHRIALDVRPLF